MLNMFRAVEPSPKKNQAPTQKPLLTGDTKAEPKKTKEQLEQEIKACQKELNAAQKDHDQQTNAALKKTDEKPYHYQTPIGGADKTTSVKDYEKLSQQAQAVATQKAQQQKILDEAISNKIKFYKNKLAGLKQELNALIGDDLIQKHINGTYQPPSLNKP